MFGGSAYSSVVETVLIPAIGRPVLFPQCLKPSGDARASLSRGFGHLNVLALEGDRILGDLAAALVMRSDCRHTMAVFMLPGVAETAAGPRTTARWSKSCRVFLARH